MSTHSFPVNVAQEYGINEAIILQHIYFWFQKNRANKKNFYDGYYWSYNTTGAFIEIFPYFTQRQIQYCLDKLQKEDLILTANYNHNKFDRTLWYSMSEKGLTYFENTILQNCEMEETKMENGRNENVKSYTDINTNIKTNIKEKNIKKENKENEIEKKFNEFYKVYNKKVGRTQALKTFTKLAKSSNVDNLLKAVLESFEIYRQIAGEDLQYWKNPSRFLDEYKDFTQEYLTQFKLSQQNQQKTNNKFYDKNSIAQNDEQRRYINELASSYVPPERPKFGIKE